jgi:hypothetical protein
MRKTYTYKLQGDGSDSWTVTEINEFEKIVSVYMVYENPTQVVGTALKAVMSASPEELIEIKKILGI